MSRVRDDNNNEYSLFVDTCFWRINMQQVRVASQKLLVGGVIVVVPVHFGDLWAVSSTESLTSSTRHVFSASSRQRILRLASPGLPARGHSSAQFGT